MEGPPFASLRASSRHGVRRPVLEVAPAVPAGGGKGPPLGSLRCRSPKWRRTGSSSPFATSAPSACAVSGGLQAGSEDQWEVPPARGKGPGRRRYTRGSTAVVKGIESSRVRLKAAKQEYIANKFAKGVVSSHKSNFRWWRDRAVAQGFSPLPLTPSKMDLFGALLRSGGYPVCEELRVRGQTPAHPRRVRMDSLVAAGS